LRLFFIKNQKINLKIKIGGIIMSRNKIIDEKAREALRLMKLEYADELGLPHSSINGGNKSSHENGMLGGYVGGLMTKKLVQMGEEELLRNYSAKK